MATFTLLVVLRAARGFDDAAIEATRGLLRPDDAALRVWRDDADPTVVRASLDCTADDLDGALARARELAEEIVAASPPDLAVEEVVAMDDDRQLVWRAKP